MGSNFTPSIGHESLDLLAEMSGLGGYEEIADQALDMETSGVRIKVLSLEQLIVTKQAAGRLKDVATLPVLRATLEMQLQNPPPPEEPTADR